MTVCLSPQQVNQAFIANAPLISETIKNLTIAAPNWYRDLYPVIPWPEGEGNSMQELQVRSEIPQIEEGFDSWALQDDPTGCDALCAPNCAYNFDTLGGHAITGKVTRLMSKDLKSPEYCVKTITTTRQWQQVFAIIVQNMYNQVNFHKEFNIGRNALISIAKKFVVDNGGFKWNTQDPYTYRPKGTATLSSLNIGILEFLYEAFRRDTNVLAYQYQNGAPLYAMVASPQLISHLYRDDPSLRADFRAAAASGGEYADALIKRYNFTNTIRDMFFPVGYPFPRRFRYDSVNNKWVQVLPWVKGLPGIVGTFSGNNPQYDDPSYATHEEVIFHGRNPFSIWYRPVPTTLGEGTDFGPEVGNGFWDNFQWHNPATDSDPGRRVGFFWTSAEIAMAADYSEGVVGLLVPRPGVGSMLAFAPLPPEPPTPGSPSTNLVPDVGCPVVQIVSFIPHPVTANRYFVTFAAPVDADADDVLQLGITTGGFVNATVKVVGSGDTTFEVEITGEVSACDRFVQMFTSDSLACSSKVLGYQPNPTGADGTLIDLLLDRPIKAITNTNGVVLVYGNGDTMAATVSGTPTVGANTWRVKTGSTVFVDNVGGIVEICVPTTTNAACPSCTPGPVVTQCDDE